MVILQAFKRSLYERCFNVNGIFVALFAPFLIFLCHLSYNKERLKACNMTTLYIADD